MILRDGIGILHLDTLLFLTPFCIVFSLLLLLICGSPWSVGLFKNDANKIIQSDGPFLFIIAHPDDECMFFAPTVIKLAKQSSQSVHLLCVTTGDYYHQGAIRQKEIYKSGDVLGIPAKNIKVWNNSAFLDGDQKWDAKELSQELTAHVQSTKPKYIFTFDDYGVSGHPNHIFLGKVLKSLHKELTSKDDQAVLLELKSVPIYRKYISFLDIFPTIVTSRYTFVSSMAEIPQGQRAMFSHWSQMAAFRFLYILFSRYMMMNDYNEVK